MAEDSNEAICPCMMKGIEEFQQVVFPDGVTIRIKGLRMLFEEACREGKKPDRSIANDLVNRLSRNNYVPSEARSEYEALVLKEYRKFLDAKEEKKVAITP
jgi:hypothetical protein